jgi:hypothetical protein
MPTIPHPPTTYEVYRDMPYLAHLEANGKSTHTNRYCRLINNLKVYPKSGYTCARKNRPCDKGGKQKEEAKEAKDASNMEEYDPKHDARGKPKNPFENKKSADAFHTFLGTSTSKAKRSALHALNATVPTRFPGTYAGKKSR